MGIVGEGRAGVARGEDVKGKNEDNETGLMWAVIGNHNSIVRLFLEQPTTDLNCTDLNGETALHWAAAGGNVEAVKLLLADPRLSNANQKNNDGCTPVMMSGPEHSKPFCLDLGWGTVRGKVGF